MYDTFLGFDSTNPNDAVLIAEYHARRNAINTPSLPFALVDHIKTTEVGTSFVVPIVGWMHIDTFYTAEDLAALFNNRRSQRISQMTTRQVASKMTVMGRPERRLGGQIFQRGNTTPQTYKVSESMKDALS